MSRRPRLTSVTRATSRWNVSLKRSAGTFWLKRCRSRAGRSQSRRRGPLAFGFSLPCPSRRLCWPWPGSLAVVSLS
ncbi:unnamed protein product [Symbiodinium microadriaticum]|nr:unnamed protein product [Symbiodinium microadriaticum]CAE7947895.1 unnamed protein product [Symbiodinium sp. KB8]